MSLVIKSIPIEKIIPNSNRLRKDLENDKVKIADLAFHIAENGLLQPIIVKEKEDNNYLICKGGAAISSMYL
jgi:ParB-like chromosome segregation protein Spo0J